MTDRDRREPDLHEVDPPSPLCLVVPGLNGSGPDHWQTRWQLCRDDCVRVQLGDWASPTRAGWVAAIEDAVTRAPPGIVLVGHSLGCLAIVCWAARAAVASRGKVRAAMLVAPPDVEQQGCDLRLLRFKPLPPEPLPFSALVVGSADDPYTRLARARRMAESWDASFVDVGRLGHVNAASNLGDWPEGQALLASLIASSR